MQEATEIFFHCGMMRTGTTYLQNMVFPHFEGVHYIHKKQFFERNTIIGDSSSRKFLISYELAMDDQWEREILNVAADWPDAVPVVVFRKQSAWLLSEYKRRLKNGELREFNELWDSAGDQGYYKVPDLMYTERLAFLDNTFNNAAVLFHYTDFQENGLDFIRRLAGVVGLDFNPERIDVSPRHRSYGEKQLRLLRSIMRYVNLNRNRNHQPEWIFRIQRFMRDVIRYGTLYVPPFILPGKKPLVPDETLALIDEVYREDWEAICVKIEGQEIE